MYIKARIKTHTACLKTKTIVYIFTNQVCMGFILQEDACSTKAILHRVLVEDAVLSKINIKTMRDFNHPQETILNLHATKHT